MIARTITTNLLAIARAYGKATGKSLAMVGKDFYGKSDFFPALAKGRHTLSVKQLEKMVERFRDDWPDDADWPFTQPVFMTRKPIE